MDLQMPNMNGTEAISRIRNEFPGAKIIVLSTYSGDIQVLRAIRAGARGYILKGHVRIPPEIAAELAEHTADDELTSREMDFDQTQTLCLADSLLPGFRQSSFSPCFAAADAKNDPAFSSTCGSCLW